MPTTMQIPRSSQGQSSQGQWHLWMLLLAVLFFSSPGLARARGFCDSVGSCAKHPWERAEVQFLGGYTAVSQGRIWEHALTLGATARIANSLFGGSVTTVTQIELWSNTRIPEVNAHAGGISLRAGLLLGEVGFTVGLKVVTLSPIVYVKPWYLGDGGLFQFYPTMQLHWRRGWFGLNLSLFDSPDTAIGRISLEFGNVGVGYSFPYGAELFVRFAIGPEVGMQVRGYANWIDDQFGAGLMIGMLWGKGSIYHF